MTFESIDPLLSRWALRKGCHLLTKYKDAEVRSIIVDTGRGTRYQLWIDPPDSSSRVKVHLWDFADYHQSWIGHIRDLEATLESAWVALESRSVCLPHDPTPAAPDSDEGSNGIRARSDDSDDSACSSQNPTPTDPGRTEGPDKDD